MLNHDQIPSSTSTSTLVQNDNHNGNDNAEFRDIHPLAPPLPPSPPRPRRREPWETSSVISSTSSTSSDNLATMSREFNALVLAGSNIIAAAENDNNNNNNLTATNDSISTLLARIGEEEYDNPGAAEAEVETNPLAIVPDNSGSSLVAAGNDGNYAPSLSSRRTVVGDETASLRRVKKEEVESKISAWQNAKVAKVNNRFKREEAVISGWESEQQHKATSVMKKVERKLEEKRARALEKMQNDIAKAHRKAEERRASAEAKRGTKIARILELSNMMSAVGRAPVKRSFF